MRALLYDTVIVRHGPETGVKSAVTRARYDRLLLKNMEAKVRSAGLSLEKVDRRFGRIYVKTDTPSEVARCLSRVFGISSTSPAASCRADLDSIAETAVKLTEKRGGQDVRFAVRCRRVGSHNFTSMDVCRYVGSRILDSMGPMGWRVDLEEPDCTIGVEVRDQDAFVYTEVIKGVGGFPLGSQGSLLCLLSSGIDSPVASWLVMKRGCTVTLLHLDLGDLGSEDAFDSVVGIARVLNEWSPAFEVRLLAISFGEIVLKEVVEKCPSKIRCVLCKRMMLRIAERVAIRRGLLGIVTGDSIGEQASQTLGNMAVIGEAAKGLPIYRPLIGFDKPETERIAREIGTYDISARSSVACKAAPSKPTVRARLEEVAKWEKSLDVYQLLEKALASLVEVSL
ncbi:MAG: tRNA uracil 4-sulfurtransferase ThiI [Candidatus Nezhaarchaeota archaeon]|nr:tRNA uracil 4-sulfurtransferase ThiI [Candidatus Nezhaarchaeota archaeon]